MVKELKPTKNKQPLKTKQMKRIGSLIYILICICTANIGMNIHGSIFWAIMDWIFMPFAWIKWVLCHEVSLTIIKTSFDWFLK